MNRGALCWLAVAAATLGSAVGAPAAGAQAQPSIEIEIDGDVAQPGEAITVTGECWGSCDGSPVPKQVTLTFKGTGSDPESAQPHPDGSFELDVELPNDLDRGERYKLIAESPDGLRATDRVFVGRRASSGDGHDDDDDDGDGADDEPDRASTGDEDDCPAPPATTDPAAPAGVETRSPADDDRPAEEQAGATDEQGQPDQCESAAPPPSAPAGPFVLGESQESNDDSDGDSGSESPDGNDSGDENDGDDRGGKGKRALKTGDGDSNRDEDDEDSGGGGGGRSGNDRGQDSAPAATAPTRAARAAVGPTPQDVRETVPWALIGVLGALFAIGLGATYHVVGRWAPEPADAG